MIKEKRIKEYIKEVRKNDMYLNDKELKKLLVEVLNTTKKERDKELSEKLQGINFIDNITKERIKRRLFLTK